MSIFKHIFKAVVNDLGCDWFCDNCGALMNHQAGFTCAFGTWTCEECGYENDVSADNIIADDWDDDDSDRLDVYEASLIWKSHGKDEDYMFGYTEEELEDA